jgi:uncharacterized protein (TIRG00374 family)
MEASAIDAEQAASSDSAKRTASDPRRQLSSTWCFPSKGGDIAKAWFMKDRSNLSGSLALSLVVFEKSCDMLSLLLWCVFGLVLYPKKDFVFWTMTGGVAAMFTLGVLLLGSVKFAQFFFGLGQRFAPGKMKEKFAKFGASWGEMHGYFWSSKARLITVTTTSVFIWFLHLLQIWLFILALKASVPFITNLALSPLAILAGLLPIPTFGGAGTRDGALGGTLRSLLRRTNGPRTRSPLHRALHPPRPRRTAFCRSLSRSGKIDEEIRSCGK